MVPCAHRGGAAFAAVFALLAIAPRGVAAAPVAAEALARAQADGTAPVIVLLREPAAPRTEALTPAARATRLAGLRARVLRAMPADGLAVAHAYQTVPGFAAHATPEALAALAAHPDVAAVDADVLGTVALEQSVPHVRADRVRARGVDGAGVTIAVIDSGVDATHPDIADALRHEECFCRGGRVGGVSRPACCPNGEDRASGAGSAQSADLHGPHVAGIAVSRGRVAPPGVAPGAALVAVRVLDDHNRGFLSDWIAALDWLAAERPDVRVVNMSLVSQAVFAADCEQGCGSQSGCATNRLFAAAIDALWERGALVFAASGNDGRPNAVAAPACVSRAVAVAAVDDDDVPASFNNRGPALDLLAPGVDIVSDGLGGGLAVVSGTSMASPHAAGLAALLLAARPGLGAAQVLELLGASGVPVRVDDRTLPRIDAFAALNAAMRAPELVRGGGGRGSDCLLELSVVPPEAVSISARAVATCVDGDPLCDGDTVNGRCTFSVTPCLNMRDPLLRGCATDEPLETVAILAPRVDAPHGSLARANVDALAFALPDFPFHGKQTCGATVPFIVERPAAGDGTGEIRMRVTTATRRDYDRVIFRCLRPER